MTDDQNQIYAVLTQKILDIDLDAPTLVAISGKDGSGKTMMADLLATCLSAITSREIIRISIDDFMNSRSVRYTPAESAGRGCYEYTFNFTGFIDNVLTPFQKDGTLEYRTKIFDHNTDTESLAPLQKSAADAIVIIDGVFLFKKSLVDYWSLKILLETDDETAIERGARRDAKRLGSFEIAKQKYIDRYMASQTIYYNEELPNKSADIIIDYNHIESPVILKNRRQ